ncbi:HAMP domain-containing sensor histidine kinase [Ideonella sp. DXS29W]|uniref:histidine kinase n=1 Tax=Ideonella lacteola TaxID=2984193 RepID=A0ABU9BWZ7_9BURK
MSQVDDYALTISKILGMIAHELRAPLARIMASAEVLQLGGLDPVAADSVETIIRNAEQASKRIGKLVRLADLKRVPPDRERFDALDVVAELARSHGVACSLKCDVDSVDLWSDETLFSQIVDNMIENAVKYGEPGSLKISVYRSDGRVFVDVHNKGTPIHDEDLAKVWTPFFRSRAGSKPGSGLGLAFVKLAASELGGHVRVTSSVEQGTTFTFAMPEH